MREVKQRYLRPGSMLSDHTVVVVRGGALVPAALQRDAQRAHEVYGTYSISVLAAIGATVDELAQRQPLVRFDELTVMTVGALAATGLRLTASGRNPLHFSIDFADLDDGIERLVRCEHRTTVNPYHEREH